LSNRQNHTIEVEVLDGADVAHPLQQKRWLHFSIGWGVPSQHKPS
jgi:hypothetical protein